MEIETCELPAWQFEELIGPTARLVALTAASPIVGSAPDVGVAAERVHDVGGLLVVDAVGAAPYALLDIDELKADVVALSAASWGGPQVGALIFREPAFLDRIPAMSLNSRAARRGTARGRRTSVRHACRPRHLDRLPRRSRRNPPAEPVANGWRRRSSPCRTTTKAASSRHLMSSLQDLPKITVIGRASTRIPAVSFTVEGMQAEKVIRPPGRVTASAPSPACTAAAACSDALGVNDEGGAVTVGLAPYTTKFEIDMLVRALGSFD